MKDGKATIEIALRRGFLPRHGIASISMGNNEYVLPTDIFLIHSNLPELQDADALSRRPTFLLILNVAALLGPNAALQLVVCASY